MAVISDFENRLLNRREVECVFKGISGKITRSEAVKAVADQLKTSPENVYLISLLGSHGVQDVKGLFYIYPRVEDARRDISEYILKRMKPAEAKPAEAGKSV